MTIARRFKGALKALALPTLAVFAASACTGPEGKVEPPAAAEAHSIPFAEPHEIITRDQVYVISWQPVGGAIPINDDFEVDVFVTLNDDARTPVEGAGISMTCFMPEHGHGMLREPVSEELGGGRYRARGFLLHMDGYWTVSATVMVDGIAASADDELRL